jgi:hypothetical protein
MARAKKQSRIADLQIAEEPRPSAAAHTGTLVQLFKINPRGIDLVCWLANASCRNNEEATRHWVQRQLRSRCSDGAVVGLEELIRRLRRRLEGIPPAFPN